MTVRDQDGKKSTLHATQNHPFYNDTAKTWTNAKNLKRGTHLKVAGTGTVVVTSVKNYRGTKEMRDLTVAEVHTYHVIAGAELLLVHNCGTNGETHPDLKYKEGWTDEQIAAANAKIAHLNSVENLVVTKSSRASRSASSRYRSAGETVPAGSDVDHMTDLQLGGADTIENMKPLDLSVNRSLGPQIQAQVKGLPVGTRVCGASICRR